MLRINQKDTFKFPISAFNCSNACSNSPFSEKISWALVFTIRRSCLTALCVSTADTIPFESIINALTISVDPNRNIFPNICSRLNSAASSIPPKHDKNCAVSMGPRCCPCCVARTISAGTGGGGFAERLTGMGAGGSRTSAAVELTGFNRADLAFIEVVPLEPWTGAVGTLSSITSTSSNSSASTFNNARLRLLPRAPPLDMTKRSWS